jgi:predicted nuclease with RNAse H fold
MRTMGVDLAAEPANTAIAVIEWRASAARVVALEIPADDEAVLRHARDADKVGIDCPLGWPDTFVEFVAGHRANQVRLPETSSADWRRSLAYRHTDEHVRSTLQMIPLSVATDRIGVTAMRAARLQVLLAQQGHVIDRAGAGLLVEIYPAAGLRHWGLPSRGYKGGKARGLLGEVVDQLQRAAPWLELSAFEQSCRFSDHALDAVMSALLARAAALGLTTPPPPDQLAAAEREGWIALPDCAIGQLAP